MRAMIMLYVIAAAVMVVWQTLIPTPPWYGQHIEKERADEQEP